MVQKRSALAPTRRTPTSYVKGTPKAVAPTHPPKGGAKGGQPRVEGVEEKLRQDLAHQLLAMSERDRQQILDNVLAAQMAQVPEKTRELELWSDAVADALLDRLGEAAYGRMIIKQAVSTRSAWIPVKRFCEAVGLLDLAPARQMSAFQLLAELLMRYARSTKAPLTPKLLANCCPNITAVFEQAFPGYLRSNMGLLPFNLRAGNETKMNRVRVRLEGGTA